MDSNLPAAGLVFLVACPIVTIGLVIAARVLFKRAGTDGAEKTAHAYLEALQAQDYQGAAALVSVTVLRDDAQRQAWVAKMEAAKDRKRLVRFALGQPRINASHDPNPGQIEYTVEAAELIRDKEYPATLGLRLAIDKASGLHRIVYSPDIYEETQARFARR